MTNGERISGYVNVTAEKKKSSVVVVLKVAIQKVVDAYNKKRLRFHVENGLPMAMRDKIDPKFINHGLVCIEDALILMI